MNCSHLRAIVPCPGTFAPYSPNYMAVGHEHKHGKVQFLLPPQKSLCTCNTTDSSQKTNTVIATVLLDLSLTNVSEPTRIQLHYLWGNVEASRGQGKEAIPSRVIWKNRPRCQCTLKLFISLINGLSHSKQHKIHLNFAQIDDVICNTACATDHVVFRK